MAQNYVEGSAVQDSANLITWAACLRVDGEILANPTNCRVTLTKCDGDGTETDESGGTETVATPSARGIFNGSMTVNLTAGALYYYYVQIADAGATDREGWVPIYVPGRTA